MIRYRVTPADPRAHLFSVTCTVTAPDPQGQVLRLPAWIRGSYLVRDFAKHVVDLRARDDAGPVAFERLDKSSLRCAPARGALTLDYTVYAFDDSVRKAFLDSRRGFFNGSSLFYAVAGREGEPVEVELVRGAAPDCARWCVAGAMTPLAVDADGWGTYRAWDYEEALDHPFELGDFLRVDFRAGGIPHSIVLAGRCEPDTGRLARDVTRIVEAQRRLFNNEPKIDRYLFLTRVLGAGYGGLEHRASTALVCARNDLPTVGANGLPREYRTFLGLVSHEYFHLWNVKRIAPAAFLDSDLSAEAYTGDLWHYEGVTSYYDDLMLLRAGIFDAPAYLDLVAETATRLSRTPGRLTHTLADASFETWVKYYQPDENSPNATVNYYIKGALAALCLDLYLRLHTTATLDAVMRELWQRYGRDGRDGRNGKGVPERGLEAVAGELAGRDLAPQFDAWLRTTAELPLAELLAEFGVEARLRAALGDADLGGRVGASSKAAGAALGIKLRPGEMTVAHVVAGGAAQRAGVSGGDALVALDGLRLHAAQWPLRLHTLVPGRDYTLNYFRGDELLTATLTADTLPQDTWTVSLAESPSAERLARRKAWLGT